MILNEIFFLVSLLLFGDSAGSNSFGGKRSKQSKSKQKSFFSPTDLIKRTKNKSPTNQEKKFIIVPSIQWCDVSAHSLKNKWNRKEMWKMPGVLSRRKWRVIEHFKCLFCVYLLFWMVWLMCVCAYASWLKNQTDLDKKNSLRKL